MKNFILVLLLLCLSACGGNSQQTASTSVVKAYPDPSQGTGSAYYPMVPKSYITYDVYDITATFDPATYKIKDVVVIDLLVTQSSLIAQATCSNYGNQPFFISNWDNVATPPAGFTSPQFYTADGLFDVLGVSYIGEGWNNGGVVSPGEPKITSKPVAGEHLDITSNVSSACGSSAVLYTYKTSYTTFGFTDPYGVGADVVTTGLVEWNNGNYDGSTSSVVAYNYTFDKNKGMIRDIVLQRIGPDLVGHGYMYVAR